MTVFVKEKVNFPFDKMLILFHSNGAGHFESRYKYSIGENSEKFTAMAMAIERIYLHILSRHAFSYFIFLFSFTTIHFLFAVLMQQTETNADFKAK